MFSITFKSTLSYAVSQKHFEINGGSNPWEKPGSSNAKTEQRPISPGKARAVDNMHSFYDLSN